MSDASDGERPTVSRERRAAAIRGSALGLLIGGGICLYFGFAWLVDAPGSASEDGAKTWFAVDQAFRWILRVVGVVFLIAAAWATPGQRAAMLLAALAEGAFALLMLAMGIESTIEARADGTWDVFTILFLLLAVVGVSAAMRSWRLYTSARPAGPGVAGDDAGPRAG